MASDHACGSGASDMGHCKQQMPNGHLSIKDTSNQWMSQGHKEALLYNITQANG